MVRARRHRQFQNVWRQRVGLKRRPSRKIGCIRHIDVARTGTAEVKKAIPAGQLPTRKALVRTNSLSPWVGTVAAYFVLSAVGTTVPLAVCHWLVRSEVF